jgi:hypothetical protein
MLEANHTAVWLSGSPMGLVILVLAAITVMYLGRAAAHGAIRALAAALKNLLELAAGAITTAQNHLVQRNREVLLEMGREQAERLMDREFERIRATVERDIGGYPALQHELKLQLARIEEDYRTSVDVAPPPPVWTKAVESIAAIPTKGDPMVVRILGDIQKSLTAAQDDATREYRKASAERHRVLHRMLPFWRSLDQTLGRVERTIAGFKERTEAVDEQMAKYERILAKSDDAERMLSASSMTHFVSSALVLLVALLGGFINFHLIALPMSEMVGATSYVGPVKTSDIAALVIIFTEIAMGLFLMESLRITRLFPVIGAMDDQLRRRMGWVSFGILLTLACVESSLAYMRDLLAADKEALTHFLAGAEAVRLQFRWIPSVGQMVMGLLLPFALAFAAIPLESFIQSSRIVGGAFVAGCLRALAGTLKLVGALVESLGAVLVHLYDFLIIVPLRIEQALPHRRARYNEVVSRP